MVGLDHKVSLEPNEFANLSLLSLRFFKARGIISGQIENGEMASRKNYHVSICSTRDIPKGHLISKEDICCKQPLVDDELFFTGLEYDSIINSEVIEEISANSKIPRKSIKIRKSD